MSNLDCHSRMFLSGIQILDSRFRGNDKNKKQNDTAISFKVRGAG